MNMHLPPQWEQRVLAIVNSHGWNAGQFAPEAVRLLTAWAQAEGGTATWNPLNTTYHIPGWYTLPDYNSSAVCNFNTPTHGVMATAATLLNGYYNGVLGFLQSPQITASQAAMKYEDQFRTWGTNVDTLLSVLAGT